MASSNVSDIRTKMRFGAAISTQADSAKAVAEVCDAARAQLDRTDLAFVFVSPHHGPNYGPLIEAICEKVGSENVLGCTGESIVGSAREIERQPALALWLAQLPDTTIQPMYLEYCETAEGGTVVGWPEGLPETWPAGTALVALGDPFSFSADAFLERVNEDHPGVPVVGGMASAGPGENRLFLAGREYPSGAVAVFIQGAVRITSIVSQGCKPIGEHFVITRCNRNVIQELGGKPPLAQLQELIPKLSVADRMRIQQGLHVGQVINEYKERFGRGDFLVRNVIDADPGSGAIAIGDLVRLGQTVQFHVRDAQSADEDLRQLIAAARSSTGSPALGALLFTCNGRGTRLFMRPNHDAGVLCELCGDIPTAGFFAQGELGPIGGKNFIHGFTASVVLFEAQANG